MRLENLPLVRALRSVINNGSESNNQPFSWQPSRFCPRFEWLKHNHIRILEGPLTDKVLEINSEILPKKATLFAHLEEKEVGRLYIERTPPGVGIILWDIAVKENYRRQGIASIMTYCIFRELLFRQDVAHFKIRMLKVMKPNENNIELQNIGICVIGNRLGFTSEFDINQLLRPANITDLTIIPQKRDIPPGLKITISNYPFVLIAFILSPDTFRPIDDLRVYLQLTKDPATIYNWVQRRLIVIGNGNYLLRSSGISQFLNHIAIDEPEAHFFLKKVRGI